MVQEHYRKNARLYVSSVDQRVFELDQSSSLSPEILFKCGSRFGGHGLGSHGTYTTQLPAGNSFSISFKRPRSDSIRLQYQ